MWIKIPVFPKKVDFFVLYMQSSVYMVFLETKNWVSKIWTVPYCKLKCLGDSQVLWVRSRLGGTVAGAPSSKACCCRGGLVLTVFPFFKRSQNQDFFHIGNNLFIKCNNYWWTKYICGPNPAQRLSFFVSLFFKCSIFSVFTKLCKHHHCLIPENFFTAKGGALASSSHFLFRLTPALGNNQLTFDLYGFA